MGIPIIRKGFICTWQWSGLEKLQLHAHAVTSPCDNHTPGASPSRALPFNIISVNRGRDRSVYKSDEKTGSVTAIDCQMHKHPRKSRREKARGHIYPSTHAPNQQ